MNDLYGIIFDVDGVIADSEAVNAQATIRVFEELFNTKNVTRADFQAGLGRGAKQYINAAARIHGLRLTQAQIQDAVRMRQQYFLEILQNNPLSPFPGVIELIDEANNSSDVKVSIATSSARQKSEAVLHSVGIDFNNINYITADDVSRKKPHPELFLTAAQKMKIPPQRCAVIEDAPNGVSAAKAARAKCIAVTNSTSADKLSSADLVCKSLASVHLDTIRKLIQGG